MSRREVLALIVATAACRRPPRIARLVRDAERAPAAAVDATSTGDSHAELLAAALARAGGLGFVGRGDRVLLKVNTNSGDPYPYSTNPATIAAIAAELLAAGAHVTVGDRSFWGDDNTLGNLEANGIAGAARDAGIDLVAFDDGVEWVEIDPALVPHWRPPVRLPRLAVEADHVINLACAKTHFITGVTLGMKNLLGLVRAGDRARPGNLRTHHDELIHHQIADINRAIAPRLTVIDGYQALVSGGPTHRDGTPSIADTRVIIAGTDRVAADIAAIELLQRHAPASEAVHATAADQHPTILAARAAGL